MNEGLRCSKNSSILNLSNHCSSIEQRGNSMVGKFLASLALGAGLCFAAGAPSAAQQADLNAPQLILINGKILTMDGR